MHITVLIPAHNEEATIGETLASLQQQVRRPNRVIVIADNCADGTADLAREEGAEVFATVDNRDKKAGGLNQVLAHLLPEATTDTAFLVMDADTVIGPRFVAAAARELETRPELGAVGGMFYGEPGAGLLGILQRNEYFRYQRDVALKGGRVMVLSGTASLIRAEALRGVSQARGTTLPGTPGQVYDTLAMTEDNELTLALKTLGWKLVSPPDAWNVTEVMPTWRALWKQRERWQRGALENLRHYGWTPVTRTYWKQQLAITYGVLALNGFLALMLVDILGAQQMSFAPVWLVVSSVFVIERLRTVWGSGWKARLVAAPLVIELAYDVVIQAVFVKSLWDAARNKEAGWNHVTRDGRDAQSRRGPRVPPGTTAFVTLGAAVLWFVLNIGDHPTLLTGWFHDALALFVAVNTVVYAMLASYKVGLRPPRTRSASRRPRSPALQLWPTSGTTGASPSP